MHSPTSDKVFILTGDVNQNDPRLTLPKYLNQAEGYENLDKSNFIEKNLCRKKQNFYFFLYVSVYVVYLIAGSWFFIFMELPEEVKLRNNIDNVKSSFLHKFKDMKGIIIYYIFLISFKGCITSRFCIFGNCFQDFTAITINIDCNGTTFT